MTTDSSLSMVYTNLVDACNEAMHAAGAFLNCAASSFYWTFRVTPIFTSSTLTKTNTGDESSDAYDECLEEISSNAEKIETLHTDEKVVVYLNSLSRLTNFLTSLSSSSSTTNTSGGNGLASTNVTEPSSSSSSSLFMNDRNAELYLKFSIWHGVKQMDSVIIKLDRLERLMSKKVEFFSQPHR